MLVNTKANMKVVQEEIFGPVVAAMPFTDPKKSSARQRQRSMALLPASGHATSARRIAWPSRLRAGTVWINCYNIFDAALPFGGYKQSGWGREMGHDALDLYTQTKAVCTRLG